MGQILRPLYTPAPLCRFLQMSHSLLVSSSDRHEMSFKPHGQVGATNGWPKGLLWRLPTLWLKRMSKNLHSPPYEAS